MTSGDDGSYSAPELPIGTYSVSVEKSGFKIGVVNGISVEVSTERRADVMLQPGDVSQTVEVSGDTLPQVESTSNTLGGIIESTVVTNLPVNGRDYQKLIFLVPGVTGSPDQITDSPGSYGVFSVNGARGRSNNFLLDGTDMNDGYRNDPAINEAGVFGTPATILPIEAIAELRVLPTLKPEYGRSAGGVINIVTKSGTNSFMAPVSNFCATTRWMPATISIEVGSPQNPFHNNQFGGALGGPIAKTRHFSSWTTKACAKRARKPAPPASPPPRILATATADNGGLVNTVIANLLATNPWPAPNLRDGSCITDGCDGQGACSVSSQYFAGHAIFESRG